MQHLHIKEQQNSEESFGAAMRTLWSLWNYSEVPGKKLEERSR